MMNNTIQIEPSVIQPSMNDLFQAQSKNGNYSPSKQIQATAQKALEGFLALARPQGKFKEITKTDFNTTYIGEGLNDTVSPLQNIYPLADKMALYAITLGTEISKSIVNLFKKNDYTLGYMLDTVASLGADNAASFMENEFGGLNPDNSNNILVRGYSPGYCGWHLSGQKKLFQQLQPETIGISLESSFLMNPLKSVTGVLVQGHQDIHNFRPDFPFCKECRTHSCVERLNNNN